MKRRISSTLVRLALVSMVIAAGCGDSPTKPTPTPPTPPVPVTPAPPPPTPPPPPTLAITKVLAFGDSMTEGVVRTSFSGWTLLLDAGLSQSYPFKLQTLMATRYSAQTIRVFNAGRAGERAADARNRFNDALSQARPELVLLLEGANDFNQPFAAGEGINARIATTVSALEDMVRDAVARGRPIMIGTLPPQRPGGRNAGAAEYMNRVSDAIRAMAAKKGAQLIDVGAQMTLADIGADGLHPTEAGYQRMAEIWLEAIKGRFER